MPVIAVIPLKSLGQAKGRLAAEFDPGTRRELVAWMFARVLHACRASRAVTDVLVVAGDAEALALPEAAGATALLEPRPGLPLALAAADAATRHADATVVVAADLPLVTAADLDAVCAAGLQGPCVVVAPTRDGGTGALLRRPAALVGTAYGPGSAAAHLDLGRAAGVRTVTLHRPGLALDVDTPEALREASALVARLPSR